MVSRYEETRYENGPYENGEFHLCVSVCYNDETAVIGGVEVLFGGVVLIRRARSVKASFRSQFSAVALS